MTREYIAMPGDCSRHHRAEIITPRRAGRTPESVAIALQLPALEAALRRALATPEQNRGDEARSGVERVRARIGRRLQSDFTPDVRHAAAASRAGPVPTRTRPSEAVTGRTRDCRAARASGDDQPARLHFQPLDTERPRRGDACHSLGWRHGTATATAIPNLTKLGQTGHHECR